MGVLTKLLVDHSAHVGRCAVMAATGPAVYAITAAGNAVLTHAGVITPGPESAGDHAFLQKACLALTLSMTLGYICDPITLHALEPRRATII